MWVHCWCSLVLSVLCIVALFDIVAPCCYHPLPCSRHAVMGKFWIWLFWQLSWIEESPENITWQSLKLLLIVFNYSINCYCSPPALVVTTSLREGKPNYDRQQKIGRATQTLLNLNFACNIILCYQCIPVHELLIVLGRVIVVVQHDLLKLLFIMLCILIV